MHFIGIDMDRLNAFLRVLRNAVVLLVFCAACDSTRAATDISVATGQAGGRAQVTSAQIDAVPVLEAAHLVRVDGNEMTLGSVEWVGVSKDGRISVLQPEEANIRFFNARGEDAGSFGRKGKGPGEFGRPIRAGWVGDSLWVQDPVLKRITIVAPDGTMSRNFLHPVKLVKQYATGPDTAGYIVSYPRGMIAPDTVLYAGLNASDETTDLFLADSIGKVIAQVVRLPSTGNSSISVPMPGGVAFLHVPYYARPRDAISSNGRYVALVTTQSDARTFTLTMVKSNGDTAFVRDISFGGVPIPQALMDSALDVQLKRAPNAPERLAAKSQMLRLLPKVYPPVTGLMIDDLGRSWVGMRTATESTRWVIFDKAGRTIGSVALPTNSRVVAAGEKGVYVIETDEDDVESVVGYAVKFPTKDYREGIAP